jgi:hypothetical protein
MENDNEQSINTLNIELFLANSRALASVFPNCDFVFAVARGVVCAVENEQAERTG